MIDHSWFPHSRSMKMKYFKMLIGLLLVCSLSYSTVYADSLSKVRKKFQRSATSRRKVVKNPNFRKPNFNRTKPRLRLKNRDSAKIRPAVMPRKPGKPGKQVSKFKRRWSKKHYKKRVFRKMRNRMKKYGKKRRFRSKQRSNQRNKQRSKMLKAMR